jgi:hypothetical protein
VDTRQGQTAVTTAALICTGLYAYRKTTETITKTPALHGKNIGAPLAQSLKPGVEGVLGVGELLPLGQWCTGMAITFIGLSVAASVNSTFGGSFAILVAVGAILGNGTAVLHDLKGAATGLGEAPGAGTLKPQTKEAGLGGPQAKEAGQPLQAGQGGTVRPQQLLAGNLRPQTKQLNQPPVG